MEGNLVGRGGTVEKNGHMHLKIGHFFSLHAGR